MTKLILPGVGAFDESMNKLTDSGLRDTLDEAVLECNMPVLGVCVGMQIMAHKSEEGSSDGLGWIDATVKKFNPAEIPHKPKLPHMGWNSICAKRSHEVLDGIDKEVGFYFLHSYYFDCDSEKDVLASSSYGDEFTCAVSRGNIFGFQFHPEKSHSNGIRLFKNFYEF